MTDTITLPAMLTIDQVAERYDTSRDTVYRWLRGQNDFPRPIPLPSRGIRWRADALDQWERANGTIAAA